LKNLPEEPKAKHGKKCYIWGRKKTSRKKRKLSVCCKGGKKLTKEVITTYYWRLSNLRILRGLSREAKVETGLPLGGGMQKKKKNFLQVKKKRINRVHFPAARGTGVTFSLRK